MWLDMWLNYFFFSFSKFAGKTNMAVIMATWMSFQPICGCLNRCSSAYIARKGESHESDVPLKTGSDCIDVRKRGRSYFFMFHQIIGRTSDINSDIITPNKIKTQIDASGQRMLGYGCCCHICPRMYVCSQMLRLPPLIDRSVLKWTGLKFV